MLTFCAVIIDAENRSIMVNVDVQVATATV